MKTVPLAHAAEVTLGRQRAPQYEVGEGQTPYLRSANITGDGISVADVKSMSFSAHERATFSLRSEDILVTEGSGSRAMVGASGVWRDQLPGPVCFQNTLLRLRPRRGTDGRYLAWWARQAHASGLMAAAASGANILHLGAEDLRRLPVNLPALDHQRRIANFLDDQVAYIDAALGQAAALRASCEQRELIHLAELFASLAPPVVRLAHLAHVQSGVTVDSAHNDPDGRAFPYLSVANVQDGYLTLDTVKTIGLDKREARRYMLRPSDVLMTEGGDLDKLGRGTVWRGEIADCLHQNHVFAVRPDPNRVLAEYLALTTRTPAARRHFQLTARKTTNLASTNSSNIRDWPVPTPSLDEQTHVVDRARQSTDAVAAAIDATETLARLLEERKRALITACVTGGFDISSASDLAGTAALSELIQ